MQHEALMRKRFGVQKCPIVKPRLYTEFKVVEHFHVDFDNLIRIEVGILTGSFRCIETVFLGLGHIAGSFIMWKIIFSMK